MLANFRSCVSNIICIHTVMYHTVLNTNDPYIARIIKVSKREIRERIYFYLYGTTCFHNLDSSPSMSPQMQQIIC